MGDQYQRGIVVEGRGAQVRVRFENDDVVSPWLDCSYAATKGAKMFTRPKPGSMVAVAMDRNWETGVVIGAVYSDADPAPASSDATTHVEFGDGSTVVFDDGGGTMNVALASGLQMSLSGTTLTVTGDLVVTGNLTAQGQTTLANTTINGINQVAD